MKVETIGVTVINVEVEDSLGVDCKALAGNVVSCNIKSIHIVIEPKKGAYRR